MKYTGRRPFSLNTVPRGRDVGTDPGPPARQGRRAAQRGPTHAVPAPRRHGSRCPRATCAGMPPVSTAHGTGPRPRHIPAAAPAGHLVTRRQRDRHPTALDPPRRPVQAPGPQGQRWSAGTRRHRRHGTLAFDALFAAGASRETGPARVPSPCPPGECRTRTCTGASASDDVAVSFHEVTIPWGLERARGECSACGPCTRMFGCTYGAAPR